MNLTLQEGLSLKQAVNEAASSNKELIESGFDQYALEGRARQGYGNTGILP